MIFTSLQKQMACTAFITMSFTTLAQQEIDTTHTHQLSEIQVAADGQKPAIGRMEAIEGTIITSGKKNEVIRLSSMNADLSSNNARQIFGRVPGITIWENDGSGIQSGVAARGLSPNRSWEFNVRQNGCDISPDVFGYPEAYYTPPSEALEKIEVIRGAASLQFGPQFGGLLNYVIKKGVADQTIVVESNQTMGSYGLFNSFNAVGGTKGKLNYYAFFHHRNAEGWRENSRYFTNTGYISLDYKPGEKMKVGFSFTRNYYVSQQPGGLTDEMFEADPQQSVRERNWFSAPWNAATLSFDYEIADRTRISAKAFGNLSERNSVGYLKAINVADSFNVDLGSLNPRQLDRDEYQSIGAEVRYLQEYSFISELSALSLGVRVYRCNTRRNQQGTGTTGNDFNLELTSKQYGKSLEYETFNYSFFAENLFQLTKKISVTPGIRYETIQSTSGGYINVADGQLDTSAMERNVLLAGTGAQLNFSETTNFYANASQAYRPVTYSELTPSATTDVIDPDLKDATGYNADAGFRGAISTFLHFDVGAFYLHYNNRIGTILKDGVNFRTNIGTSVSKGIEAYVDIDPLRALCSGTPCGSLSLFASLSFIDARYTRWNNPGIVDDPAKAIAGKRVESAPRFIHRFGATYALKKFSATFQFNKVGDAFSDAANTIEATSNGQAGLISAYTAMDFAAAYSFSQVYSVKAGVNNLGDERYFTRRAGGYPGPGLLPANGRTWFMSFSMKI
ncbi:MAG: TonB-dependent receptor [Flavobacteriales bacterium]|nr:TonB-dependent receptor [Flavobacteriales bacterium]